MIFSENNQNISAALVKAWGSIETPKHNAKVSVKTKTGGTYEFTYTDLDGIFDAVRNIYKQHGIAILQNAHTERVDGVPMVSVSTMLLHETGEWVRSEPLQMTANPNIQEMGGQITYMKRYSLSAMLGIATEKDDDANFASGNEAQFQPRKLSEAQVNRLYAIAKSKGFSVAQVKEVLMKDYKKTAAEDLTKQEYDTLCNRLTTAKANKNENVYELSDIEFDEMRKGG